MPDKIHLTVAAIVESDNKFLIVREQSNGRSVLNQPAGHVEPGETIIEALLRETHEETGWRIEPKGVLSFSSYSSPHNNVTYYRISLCATPVELDNQAIVDTDILEVMWLDYDEIVNRQKDLRSPMVLDAIDDYRAGRIYPLALLREHR